MGTALQRAVQSAVSRGVPVGGTSAGCDVQGNYIYTAAESADDDGGSNLDSEEALRDPYYYQITLQEGPFISHAHPQGLLKHVIVDTHFVTRDRMGRMIAFLARLWKDGMPAIGVGINEQTAIAINPAGVGTVLRQSTEGGQAFVFTPGHKADVCEPGHFLEYANVTVQKLQAGNHDTFNFVTLSGGDEKQRWVRVSCRGHSSVVCAIDIRGCTS